LFSEPSSDRHAPRANGDADDGMHNTSTATARTNLDMRKRLPRVRAGCTASRRRPNPGPPSPWTAHCAAVESRSSIAPHG